MSNGFSHLQTKRFRSDFPDHSETLNQIEADMNNQIVLQLNGISKSYGAIKALKKVDFTLRAGEIHAIAGENGAGKSTLMKIIDGIIQPDEGDIILHGQKVIFPSALHAQQAGIGFVHQEIALCPDMSVSENVCMSKINASKKLFVDYKKVRREAEQALSKLEALDPMALVSSLSISHQQIVEIAKALTLECKILILDEPTSTLTDKETSALFAIMHQLKDEGMSIIFISHRMSEVFEHCDHITVMRDGEYVMDTRIADTNPKDIVNALVGREMDDLYPEKANYKTTEEKVLLNVKGITDGQKLKNISLNLHRGEILGISGLVGSGRTELMQTICGLRNKSEGQVCGDQGELRINNYSDAIDLGIVYLSEDRKAEGVFLDLPIAQNVSALRLKQVSTSFGLMDKRKEFAQAVGLTEKLQLKSGGMNDPVSSLSGGNQQKVAIAKLLTVEPLIILLDEPTRGVDVGAKSEIHALLRQFADEGKGIMVVSSELPEIIGLCDRVLVMSEGRLVGELHSDQISEENIMTLASGIKLAS